MTDLGHARHTDRESKVVFSFLFFSFLFLFLFSLLYFFFFFLNVHNYSVFIPICFFVLSSGPAPLYGKVAAVLSCRYCTGVAAIRVFGYRTGILDCSSVCNFLC